MDTTQQMLGVLLNVTEQQSQATEKLLVELKGQIAALGVAAKVTQHAAASVGDSAASVEQAAKNAGPVLQKAAGEAVGLAVKSALAGASGTAVAAMEDASRPILLRLSNVAAAVGDAEERLNGATASFGWKWAVIAGGTLICTLGVFMAFAWLIVAWQRYEVEQLNEQKIQLRGTVADLQEQAEVLTQKGGKVKFNRCGPDNRLCIEITPSQGKDVTQTDFQGSWQSSDGKKRFVIPKGY